MAKKSYTVLEIIKLKQGIDLLMEIPVNVIGVENLWKIIEASGIIKPIVSDINDIQDNLKRTFFTVKTTESGEQRWVLDLNREKEYLNADREAGKKTFELNLPVIDCSVIDKIKSEEEIKDKINGQFILSIMPILKKE